MSRAENPVYKNIKKFSPYINYNITIDVIRTSSKMLFLRCSK